MEILIAVDDLISRDLLNKAVTAMGHRGVMAATAAQAWQCIRERPIRLVIGVSAIMNALALLKMNGDTVGKRPVYRIKIVAPEGHEDPGDLTWTGADDFIALPIHSKVLETRLGIGMRAIELEDRFRVLQETLVRSAAENEAKNNRLQSALRRLEETQAQMVQSEKMASIGQLAAGVAHEINNPTGFISSNLKTLVDYQDDIAALIARYQSLLDALTQPATLSKLKASTRASIEEILSFEQNIDISFLLDDIADLINDCREGANRIKKIVRDLKDFAHPGDDRLQSMDINRELNATLNVVNNALKYKASVELDLAEVPAVRGYPQKLNQVFMNVLINAGQAIEKKGVIKVRTRFSNGAVEVIISDNGRGVSPEHLSKIFDPFFTTKEVGQGTGLGMNIAYNIVRQHNGTIDVASRVGRGTTFTIRLPAGE